MKRLLGLALTHFLACFLTCLLACASTPRAAQSGPDPACSRARPRSRDAWASCVHIIESARAAHDLAEVDRTLLEATALLPNSPSIDLALARNANLRGQVTDSIAWLDTYAARGLTIDLAADPGLKALASDPRAQKVTARLTENARPVTRGSKSLALPRGDLLFEDLAWDAGRAVFYVTSVRGQKLIELDPKTGSTRDVFAIDRPGVGILGVAIDPSRKKLWLTEAPLPPVPGFKKGDAASTPNALVALDSTTHAPIQRIELAPDGQERALTDLAIAPSGDVLVSDAAGGTLYLLESGQERLRALATIFASPQTPAPRDDGRAYVPDYSLGIALVDLRSAAVTWLSAPKEIALAGIDGLYLAGNALIAVQNGTRPPRLVRFDLSSDGTRIEHAAVLEAGTPDLGEPTHGAIVDGSFWFLASSGWSRFDDDGAIVKDPPADAPSLWRIPLSS
jgi:hypothetical protein